MENSTIRKDSWDSAAKAGLVLGGVSIAYMLLTSILPQAAEGAGAFVAGLVSLLLWAAKFAGCLYLMHVFMERFVASHPDITRRESFLHGSTVACASALIYSAFYYAYVTIINPGMFKESMEVAMETYKAFMDSNSLAMLEQMTDQMPTISFFTNLIYCTIFGMVLASIYSSSLVSSNPFDKPEDNTRS